MRNWPLESELRRHFRCFRPMCRLTTPSSVLKCGMRNRTKQARSGLRTPHSEFHTSMVLPRGNAPWSLAYRARALLLSYRRMRGAAAESAAQNTNREHFRLPAKERNVSDSSGLTRLHAALAAGTARVGRKARRFTTGRGLNCQLTL